MSGLVEKNYFVEVREMRRRRAQGDPTPPSSLPCVLV